jgi:peptide chain release factor 2
MSDNFEQRILQLKDKLKIDTQRQKVLELEQKMAKPDFWKDHQQAAKKSKEHAALKEQLAQFEELQELFAARDFNRLEKALQSLELRTFLSGPYDQSDAIFSLQAGAGGVEAMDWTEMLFRMYSKYFDSQGWKWQILDESLGEEAGIKSVTIEVKGQYAFGYLKGEAGVHRLVRQSPFNADNLRQTSFALVEVVPVLTEVGAVELNDADLKVETFRSSGPGGQHMQKTESAVRITHLPTGITASCQAERVQQRNKEKALQILRSRIAIKLQQKQEERERQIKGERQAAEWGHQIRNYVLHPYKLVKDLRTGVESSDPESVLSGHLDEFVQAELKQGVGVV